MMTSVYREVESRTINNFNLRCIDGSIHGCGKCVGYCAYTGHTGFLTAELEAAHNCIEKGCFYHHPKPAAVKRKQENIDALKEEILASARDATKNMEGLRVLRSSMETPNSWIVYYAAIAAYDVEPAETQIAASTGFSIQLRQISCDFDMAVALVMAG